MANKNIYLTAFYTMKPKDHVNTSTKGWMDDPDNIRYDEKIELSRGEKKNFVNAKVILDLSSKTVKRNGWNNNQDFKDLFKYFFANYSKYMITVMTQLDPAYLESIVEEFEKEIAEAEAKEAENEKVQAE